VRIRELEPADRIPIEHILCGAGNFTNDEIDVALELIDHGIHGTDVSYCFLVSMNELGAVTGYACFGQVPMTDGTYDLYWIAVEQKLQGAGIGHALMDAVEKKLRVAGARLLLIETASKPSYTATRAFYERIGYELMARIPDFYRPGDDKVIYGRRLA
jgi:ribosomal protein S18 acetylase RimI-like enzyme